MRIGIVVERHGFDSDQLPGSCAEILFPATIAAGRATLCSPSRHGVGLNQQDYHLTDGCCHGCMFMSCVGESSSHQQVGHRDSANFTGVELSIVLAAVVSFTPTARTVCACVYVCVHSTAAQRLIMATSIRSREMPSCPTDSAPPSMTAASVESRRSAGIPLIESAAETSTLVSNHHSAAAPGLLALSLSPYPYPSF